ncbi:MAG: ROK family protein, partial [Oscillospiraceae bacterium]
MRAGNQTLLKKNNQRAITDYIIQNGPISRADLSKKLKISKPTVSANVAELIDMHLLKEIGYSETDIGKKPMLVDFDKDFRYVLALDFISYIAVNKISVAVCNLYCDPIFIDTINFPPDFDSNFVKKSLPKSIMELFKRYDVSIDKIGKMVISAPTVWYDDDHVNFECRTGEIVNLSEIFRPYFKNRIVVKNDINLAALGERYFGVGKNVDTLFFAWIGIGVGGGIILDGELYEGKAMN